MGDWSDKREKSDVGGEKNGQIRNQEVGISAAHQFDGPSPAAAQSAEVLHAEAQIEACGHTFPSAMNGLRSRDPEVMTQARELALADSMGPGAVQDSQQVGLRKILLVNFTIGSAVLKPEHESWLLNTYLYQEFTHMRLEVTGHTSRSGPAPENEALGLKRAHAVLQLLQLDTYDPVIDVKVSSVGESESPAADATECGVDRAVSIMVIPLPQVTEFQDGEVINPGRDKNGDLEGGFYLRECPESWVVNKALELRRDKTLEAMDKWVGITSVASASTAMMGMSSPAAAGSVEELVAVGVNLVNSDIDATSAEVGPRINPRRRALVERIWAEYSHQMARKGRGFDDQYRIIDKGGNIVDTWWHEHIR